MICVRGDSTPPPTNKSNMCRDTTSDNVRFKFHIQNSIVFWFFSNIQI
jgi:hypothetical protein